MKDSMQQKLNQLLARAEDLHELLAKETATDDLNAYRKLSKEHAELSQVVGGYRNWLAAKADLETAQTMLLDIDMRSFAEDEIPVIKAKMEFLAKELQILLLPVDANDERNIFLEIRAGTGGDESSLFAADLLRMYTRFAERNNWQVEMISESASDLGGYKEIVLRIIGFGAYSRMKFESGGHRVQRVPITETQGRIHTSACTVAVLAEADAVSEVKINPSQLRIDTFRASGAGGQHINKTDSAVRITHLPTGIVVECQDDRSQHRNREQALKVLAARIKNQEQQERQAKEASTRKLLIGSGDRSDRIRTYNFPQGRISDHRINLTLYKIDAMMDGDLNELLAALAAEYQADLLAALGSEE